MASTEEEKIFAEEILTLVGNNHHLLPNKKLTGFMSLEGSKYSLGRELMVVGRAVNGWMKDNLQPEKKQENILIKLDTPYQ